MDIPAKSKEMTPKNAAPAAKSPHCEREERILASWNKDQTFKKSLDKPDPKGEFTFYDGPPFATGLPHYGHLLAGTIKDIIPRWKTMQGYRVRRRWGWDCHGLPVENMIEKELGLKSKKDIVSYGVGRFNQASRDSVMRYADVWRTIVPRFGRWVDMDDDYRTMDASYTESVWWIFQQLHKKGLIYEGFKSMNLCPRCETTLSNFEVAQGYRDITDISVYVKFELADEKGVSLIAWTTTPWTLPGNVALAVNPTIEYVKVAFKPDDVQASAHAAGTYVVAKARLEALKGGTAEVLSTMTGSELVGKSYKPMFDYYANDTTLKNRENGWKIYGADFVTTEDGTGIVHIAPAFGADDYALLEKHSLPFVQHVAVDGHFKPEVADFAGLAVKPIDTKEDKEAHQKTDIEVIKWLAHHGVLFAKEKLIHSYPHCWRCETPLLNYAASSWFVRVTDFKDRLVSLNKKISWVPTEVGEGRFGNWLEGARDWAISRSRFWGAPIPVWKNEKTGEHTVFGSIDELRSFSTSRNTYYIIRHGEAENNVQQVISAQATDPHHLTAKGRAQVTAGAAHLGELLKGQHLNAVFVSPFVRTRETADIICSKLGISPEIVRYDSRIGEWNTGDWDGKSYAAFVKEFPHDLTRFEKRPANGETYAEVKKRMGDFIYDLEARHEGQNILLVTHETPAVMLLGAAKGLDRAQIIASMEGKTHGDFYKNAEVRKLDFAPLPHNAEYELDLHRPFIDDVVLRTPEGHRLTRVPDVFDCWFESGSMPYASNHYPFENRDIFEPRGKLFSPARGYPADFIAEGLDQTRGWFYSMIVLGTALFDASPYKKVIVNGLILAEDGQKMSKSKLNYPDPMALVEKYGADAIRYYMVSSPVVRGQDLCFSERGVDEVVKKLVNRLLNVLSFYEMYEGASRLCMDSALSAVRPKVSSPAPLDVWIGARLDETILAVSDGLEKGELDRAARPFMDLVDDVSTWYLRRSRDRFKGDDAADKRAALDTTRIVLASIARLLAPFMPFLAEEVYQRLAGATANAAFASSVHLTTWPTASTTGHGTRSSTSASSTILKEMAEVRGLASRGLELRTTAKMNVRQPLAALKVKAALSLSDGLVDIIKDEVNVKTVQFGADIHNDLELDLALTPELRAEGEMRELLRKVQDLRKEAGLSVGDVVSLVVPPELWTVASDNAPALKKMANISSLSQGATLSLSGHAAGSKI